MVVTFAAFPADRVELLRRTLERAGSATHRSQLATGATPADQLAAADVLVCLPWPDVDGTRSAAEPAMAAGKAVIVLETTATAHWPAFDPQTWGPRPPALVPPVVVSLDVRDEEHSLLLAVQRLTADAALRARLGEAARAWVAKNDLTTTNTTDTTNTTTA
jgi:hypothetical protein